MEIISRGKKITIKEEFLEGNHIFYGSNGTGKSTICAGFKSISNNYNTNKNYEMRIDDEITGLKGDVSKLQTWLANEEKEIIALNPEQFIGDVTFDHNHLIIAPNAKMIQELKEEINTFKGKVGTQAHPIKKMLLDKFGKVIAGGILANLKIKKDLLDFGMFHNVISWVEINSKYINITNQEEIYKMINLCEDILEYINKFSANKLLENINSKYNIRTHEIQSYEGILNSLKAHSKVSHAKKKCPVCLSDIDDLDVVIDDIEKEIELTKNERKEKYLDLYNKYKETELDFEWNEKKELEPINKTKLMLKVSELKTIDIKEIQTSFIWNNSRELRDMYQKNIKLQELLKEQPKIKQVFIDKMKDKINNMFAFDAIEWDMQISRNQKQIEFFLTGNPHTEIHHVLSSSMVKMLSLYNFTINEELSKNWSNKLVVIDDPVDSNDYMNISIILNEIKEIAQHAKATLIFTHDTRLLSDLDDYFEYSFHIINYGDKELIIDDFDKSNFNSLSISNMHNNFNSTPEVSWEELLLFSMVNRYLGKFQKNIVENRSLTQILETHNLLFNEISKLMHHAKINEQRMKHLLDELCKLYGKKMKNKFILKPSKTRDISEALQKHLNKSKTKQLKNRLYANMNDAVLLRIKFEEKLVQSDPKLQIINSQDMENWLEKIDAICFDKTNNNLLKFKKFYNQYWKMINLVSHTIDNDLYKFIDINKNTISKATKELEKL